MKRLKTQFFLAMLLSALMVVTVKAQETKQQEKKQDSAEEKQEEPKTFAEIRSAMSKEQSVIVREIRTVKPGSAEYQELLNKYYGIGDKYADKILALVKEDPTNRVGASMLAQLVQMSRNAEVRDKAIASMLEVAKADGKGDAGFQMLMMLVTGPVKPMIKTEAQALLMKNFGDSPKMGEFAMSLTRSRPSPANIQLLRDLLKKSMDKSVLGPATYALGKFLSANEKTKEEGMALIKSIPEKFAGVKVYNGRMELAKMVEGEIFEMENLQIGMEVPDIKGEDVDGVEFKLSDYRGKVVVIDFWGDW